MGERIPVFEPMEPRILLSGSPAPQEIDQPCIEVNTECSIQDVETEITEILFVDPSAVDINNFFDNFNHNVEVFLLPEGEDGISFMTEVLQEKSNISGVHIVSHGNEGQLHLGSAILSESTLDAYRGELSQWKTALSPDADILFYGCNFGQNESLINELSSLTEADIAASDDYTGSDYLGGDAELEIKVGEIETSEIFTQSNLNKMHIILAQPDLAKAATYTWNPNNSSQPINSSNFPSTSNEGGDLGLVWEFTGSEAISADSLEQGTFSSNDASFEVYFETESLSADGEYLLFETGGNADGTSLWVDRSGNGSTMTLHLLVQHGSNKYFTQADISGMTGFINAGFTINTDASNGQVKLYVDGTLQDTSGTGNLDKWSGNNNVSIGGLAGDHATVDESGVSLNNFVGKIARINIYNALLSDSLMAAANNSIELANNITLGSVNEGLASPAGETVANLISDYFNDADGDTFAGIAIGTDNSNGTQGIWQYSTDNGTSWFEVGTVSSSSSLLLESTAKLRFLSFEDFSGSPGSLEVYAVDSSHSLTFTSGNTRQFFDTDNDDPGTSAVGQFDRDIVTSINNINDAAVFYADPSLKWDADLPTSAQPLNATTLPPTTASGLSGLGQAWVLDGTLNNTFSTDGFNGTQRGMDASFEIWFKPDTSVADGNYYIYETGGDGRGTTLWMEKSSGVYTLHLHIQPVSDGDNASKVDLTYDISSLVGSYIQTVFTIDLHSTAGTAKLYVNGEKVNEHTGVLPEWSGGDNSGVGRSAGSSASIKNDVSPVNYFSGNIAVINYFDSVLEEPAIISSYNHITGNTQPLNSITYPLRATSQPLVTDLTLRDFDSPNFNTGSLTVEITSNADAVNDTLATALDYSSYGSLNGSSTDTKIIIDLNSNATPTEVAALIESMTFYSESISLLNREVTISINDGDGATSSFKVDVDVNVSNNAPVLADAVYSLTSINEDDTSNSGQTVASFVGANISDVDAGASSGIAVTSLSGNGTWQYKTGLQPWADINLTNGSLHLFLTDKIRYIPDQLNSETATFNFRAWDQSNGLTNGVVQSLGTINVYGSYSLNERTAQINVTSLNDSPQFTVAPTLTFDADVDNGSLPLSASAFPTDKVDTNFGNLGKAWNFTGTPATTESFDAWNSDDASFELWFKPDTSVGDGNYLIYETGGTTHGLTLWLNKTGSTYTIELLVRYDSSNAYRLSQTLSGEQNDYMQVAFSIFEDASNGEIKLYVNGAEKKYISGVALNDWAGSDNTSIGGPDSAYAASPIPGLNMTNFTGQIALINFYNSVVDNVQVDALYKTYGTHSEPQLTSIDEDSTNPSGNTVNSLLSGILGELDQAQTLAGAVITADGSNASQGFWQYSTNNGTDWFNVGSVSNSSALTLNANSLLRFVPTADYNGDPGKLTVRAVDSSNGTFAFTNGGIRESVDVSTFGAGDELSLNSIDVGLTVNPVNDNPVISIVGGDSATASLTEVDVPISANGTLTVTDIESFDTVNFSLASVAASGVTGGLQSTNSDLLNMFMVTGSIDNMNTGGVLNWSFNSGTERFDYLSLGQQLVLTYTVQAVDDSGALNNTGAYDVTVTVTGTNDQPSAQLVSLSQNEDGGVFTTSLLQGVSEIDIGDSHTVRNISYTLTGPFGRNVIYSVSSDGRLEIDLHQFNELLPDELVQLTFSYEVVDSSGVGAGDANNKQDSISAQLTLTVLGKSESPPTVVAIPAVNALNQLDSAALNQFEHDGDNIETFKTSSFQESRNLESLTFVSGKSSLQFNQKSLHEEPLNVINPIFNVVDPDKSEVAQGDSLQQEVIDKTVFDLPKISESELKMIEDLRVEEIRGNDEENQDSDDEDEFSYHVEDEISEEMSVKEKPRYRPVTQYDLDLDINLNDSLVGEFDCTNSTTET